MWWISDTLHLRKHNQVYCTFSGAFITFLFIISQGVGQTDIQKLPKHSLLNVFEFG